MIMIIIVNKEEEDLPALKTALTHRYNDEKTAQKSAEEN